MNGHGRRRDGAARQELQDPPQHLTDPFGIDFRQLERLVLAAGIGGGDVLHLADVGQTHLHEAAAGPAAVGRGAQQPQGGVHELSAEGVEDHVHAAPAAGRAQEPFEIQVAGGGQPVLGESVGGQAHPLVRAGRPEHARAHVPGEQHGGRTHAARRRVHQDVVPGAHTGEVHQRVVGGQEDDGDGRGLLERPVVGEAGEPAGVGDRHRTERAVEQAGHPVTRPEPAGTGTLSP